MTNLNIEIDETLSYNKQIDISWKKLSRSYSSLSKVTYFILLHTLIFIYYATFHYYISCSSFEWGFNSRTNIEKFSNLKEKVTFYDFPYIFHAQHKFLICRK